MYTTYKYTDVQNYTLRHDESVFIIAHICTYRLTDDMHERNRWNGRPERGGGEYGKGNSSKDTLD